MKLGDNYEIIIDERNVVLRKYIEPVEKTKTVDGIKVSDGMSKGHWDVCGYYPSHQALLRAFVAMELRGTPQEINVLLGRVNELYELIDGLDINYVYQCNCKKIKEEQGND